MSTYEIALFLHIVGALLWVGGATFATIMGHRAVNRGDVASLHNLVSDFHWAGPRYYLPLNVITIGAGIWATIEGPWSFKSAWISVSLALFVVSFLIGAAFFGPQGDKLSKSIADGSVDDALLRTSLEKLRTVQLVDLAVLWAIVVLMVFKP